MKTFMLIIAFATLSLQALADDGLSQTIENCTNKKRNITLTVKVVENSYLEAHLIDGSSTKYILDYRGQVAATDFGYQGTTYPGETMSIRFDRWNKKTYATVLVGPANSDAPPRQWARLKCDTNFK